MCNWCYIEDYWADRNNCRVLYWIYCWHCDFAWNRLSCWCCDWRC